MMGEITSQHPTDQFPDDQLSQGKIKQVKKSIARLFLVSGYSGGKFVNIAPAPVLGKPQMKGHVMSQGAQQIMHVQDSQGRVRQVVKVMQVLSLK